MVVHCSTLPVSNSSVRVVVSGGSPSGDLKTCVLQVAVVTGSCTAGGAYVPSMCDEAVIVEGSGSMYLGGPPLVHAATGEMHTSEELGGANVHCSISGCTDHFARTEEEAVAMARGIVGALNLQHQWPPSAIPALPPLLAAADEDFSQLIPAAVEQPWPMLHVCYYGYTSYSE